MKKCPRRFFRRQHRWVPVDGHISITATHMDEVCSNCGDVRFRRVGPLMGI